MPPNNRIRRGERGNVFIFILLGIVFFAALAFTLSRGMQSQTTTMMSERELKLAATDILSYAQKMGRAVDRLRRKGCSENEISFENDISAGYTPVSSVPAKCEVFTAEGGNISWQSPPGGVNDGSEWVITGGNRVKDIGDDAERDLIIILPYLESEVCNALNELIELDLSVMPPVDTSTVDIVTKFTGSYGTGASVLGGTGGTGTPDFTNIQTACFEADNTPPAGTLHFYYLLLER